MSHQLVASDYSPNFHRNGPPPPPPSTYNPRRTDHVSYGGKEEGLNHMTNNHHHLPLNQTTPINTSPTTSSFYNNKRSPMQLHQYHHLRSNNVAALPSSSEDAAPLQKSSALSDALADLEMAKSNARPRNIIPSSPPDSELVVQAIEVASSVLRDQASALRDQISDNEKLRSALRVTERELQNHKIAQAHKVRQIGNVPKDDVPLRPSTPERSGLVQGSNPIPGDPLAVNRCSGDPLSSLIVHPDTRLFLDGNHHYPPNGLEGHQYGQYVGINGFVSYRNQQNGGLSQTSSPTARASREGEFDSRMQPGAHGNLRNWQELIPSTLKPQEEIKQLKRQLTDSMSKEMELVHENQFLQRRIHELRQTIEKYQQDLIEKPALVEENARLKSEIWSANQDIRSSMSSLMSLLVDYNLQPETEDPYSIVSGIKVLVQHLREEGRRDSIPSNQPWDNSHAYKSAQQDPSPSRVDPRLQTPRSPGPHGLDMVPMYGQAERPYSPSSPLIQSPNYFSENVRRPNESQNFHVFHTRNDPRINSDEDLNPVRGGQAHDTEPHLPTLHEESSSDESDPLPGIEGLHITEEAVLGNKIRAVGNSINGTRLCHFQWVRHNKDGSYFHIAGAAQPEYTITADDIDTRLSLECTPMDDKNRKGNMISVFVNDRNFITLQDDIKDQLSEYLNSDPAIFSVKLGVESSQDSPFEPATLILKRSGYELKKLNGKKVVANERYASESPVEIKVGKDCQCAIINSGGIIQLLDCEENRTRDLLVLTMRALVKAAIDRKRTKKVFWK